MYPLAFHEKAVEVGTPNASANGDNPPNFSMMSETVMGIGNAENRNALQARIADCVIYPTGCLEQRTYMLTTGELLARLEQKGIKGHQIAKALGVSPSRVTEMRKGERAIKLDEAVKLVSEFGLEEPPPSPRVSPLPAPIARLIVLYVATELGIPEADRKQVEALAEDVRAFAEFVTDPTVRESIEAAELFFQAMRLRRPAPTEEDPQGTDPLTAK
jgi:transcriptional regulator with XRE-family HTH domain